ncbi:MAG: His/Gly/Thr/Pro-type tRNA ligase C-terminal domain-containing protein [Caldilineales bacterium]|nr:His/Gly/Thr/Pro-type tRNA ligase C-terminal domain-containing protein [Caldilineales bacterium]MDW8317823.1 YbaK/EbsC family protein [Anaerolineae bacterium]
MRMSTALLTTLRDAPAEAELPGYQLLLRAGFVHPLAPGAYALLPLGRRSLHRIESLSRQALEEIGSQEVTLPQPGPAAVLALVQRGVASYRQLPQRLYQVHTAHSAEARPRRGLFGSQAAQVVDVYAVDSAAPGMEQHRATIRSALLAVLSRSGLDAAVAAAGPDREALVVPWEVGDEEVLRCPGCGYTALRSFAALAKPTPAAEPLLPAEKVATPGCKTIAELAAFLAVPHSRTAKAVFYVAEGEGHPARFVFAVVRGDTEVSEAKLAQAVAAQRLRPATEAEIRAVGAEPGYGSPVGVRNALVVVDDLAAQSPNLVAGANEAGYHLRNVNVGRDYTADVVADIALAAAGDRCSRCTTALASFNGVVVGWVEGLGTQPAEAVGALFQAEDGQRRPFALLAAQLDLTRALAAVAEVHRDEQGLRWPAAVAPAAVHLVLLPRKAPEAVAAAEQLYADLAAAGVEVLYDDREDPSPGVKFNDADLIGLPLRITVGARSLQEGGVELKRRDQADKRIVPLDRALEMVRHELAELDDR